MNYKYQYIIFGVIAFIIINVSVPVVVYGIGINHKIDEIPQYNCFILNTQFEKWKYDTVIYQELQKEWVEKECYLEEIFDAQKHEQRMIDDELAERKFMEEWN